MTPILEQRALAASVSQSVQILRTIAAEPGERRQQVRARQHVDGIDLHHAQLLEATPQLPLADLFFPARLAEALRGKRNAAGFG